MINPFKSKKGLGRGLSSLIGDSDVKTTSNKISISSIIPNKNQPRSGEIFFQANGDETQEEDIMMIKLTRKASQNLSFNLPDAYNYKELGETWSAPRIFRLPNRGAGDNSILDDTYVAVMGGGYGLSLIHI